MNIRSATISDIELLHTYDQHIRKQEWNNILPLHRVYLLEENAQFAGWLRYQLFWDNTPFMNMLYILEEHRSKGFGKQLVAHWEKEMKRMGYHTVMTSTAANETAQHFYHQLGYKTVGGFFPAGEGFELILSKSL